MQRQVGASGAVCVAYKIPDSIKRNNITLALCAPNPEFEEMLCGGNDLVSAPLLGPTSTTTSTTAAISSANASA